MTAWQHMAARDLTMAPKQSPGAAKLPPYLPLRTLSSERLSAHHGLLQAGPLRAAGTQGVRRKSPFGAAAALPDPYGCANRCGTVSK